MNIHEDVEKVNPYAGNGDKGKQVEEMFDSIAPAYDFMNTAMTLGMHKIWRDKALSRALSLLPAIGNINILDVATGTGDVAFRLHSMVPLARITGIDLSIGMLDVARKKLAEGSAMMRKQIAFGKADCMSLPFHDGEFNMVTVAYGVRNFGSLLQGLREIRRVLAKGGVLCVIELSCPRGKATSMLYNFYSRRVIPFIGKKVSGDSRAYSYLPESIAACPQREEMALLMRQAGFTDVKWKSLTFGAVTYYLAK